METTGIPTDHADSLKEYYDLLPKGFETMTEEEKEQIIRQLFGAMTTEEE